VSPLSKLIIAEPESPVVVEPESDEKVQPSHLIVTALVKGGNKSSKGKGRKSNKNDGVIFSTLSQTLPHMKMRFPDNKPYKVCQLYEALALLTSSNVAFTNGAYFTNLNNVSQTAQFAALFDQYRITKVEQWILPRNPSSPTGAAVYRGLLYSVIDYDDASALSAATDYMAYTNCLVSPATEGHYRVYTPHIAVAAYAGAFTSYQNEEPQWIDTGYPAVQHYGLKIGIGACDAAADEVVLDLITRIHFEFRNLR